ncbi:MAG: SUMF1/EgtB/PvdO family nonheme iron enzyme, partial [Desulfovermiculus sp.]|nr:SUMF1/EgtB/PvdO family nonheme iron enzyme [Desulfovermiculus sp.]
MSLSALCCKRLPLINNPLLYLNLFSCYQKLNNRNINFSKQRVGGKAANDLGIYDMSGNLWEWCIDVYKPKAYISHEKHNPQITNGNSKRVCRG